MKVSKPEINAFKEFVGGTQVGATQFEGCKRTLLETMHETSRALNA